MPVVKMKHVVSFSSEDENHPADNMIKPETYYKWRCATAGEVNASIVLQLEKATQLSGVDIGNNGSAFIEVLVGRSSWSKSEEFQVLLLGSSFMTPSDSKAGKENNRVRMFGIENLNKPVASEKWDQVKIVCTQPYNQSEPYGLSFVKLYTPVDVSSVKSQEKTANIGRFKLKSDSDDESSKLSSGSFFQKRMHIPLESPVVPKLSMAASARSSDPSPRTNTIFKTKAEESSTFVKKISISEDRRQEVANALYKGAENQNKGSVSLKVKASTAETIKNYTEITKRKIEHENKQCDDAAPPNKKLKDTPKLKVKKKNVQYNKVMSGVVFTLSGYQNPERGNIRDLALSMGAKYEPSWSSQCTHLICAFANTPKFKEVKGKGKIITKKWIYDCDKTKRRLNTKNYRLDNGGDSSFESSDEEETADVVNTGEEEPDEKISSECDTEDEIEKIRMLEKKVSEKDSPSRSHDQIKLGDDDAYDLSTDDSENENTKISSTKEVPGLNSMQNFFENKHFFLYGEFDIKDRRLLKRHITSYSGSLSDYMTESINFVISEENWDHNFQQALDDNAALIFIQPKWIFKCHEKEKFVPYNDYEIKPPPS